MGGDSLARGRLSAITGASSAAGGTALSGIGLPAAGLATGFASAFKTLGLGADLTSAALPPLMLCSAGLPGFALATLPAVLTDLLALFFSHAPYCLHPDCKNTMFLRSAIRHSASLLS